MANGVYVNDDQGFREVEERGRSFEAVGCGGGAGEAGCGEEVHAFRVVLGGDDGDGVEEGRLEGEVCEVGLGGLAEEKRDGVRVGDVGCLGGVVDAEAEEGRSGGGGSGHGGTVSMVLVERVRVSLRG